MDGVILRSTYRRRLDAGSDTTWFGTFDLELDRKPGTSGACDATDLPRGSRLALWCAMQLEPSDASGVRVVERLAGHLVLEPIDGGPPPSWPWMIEGLRSRFPARHSNDGPEAAWLILPDGSTVIVDVEPSRAAEPPRSALADSTAAPHDHASVVPVTPHPRQVELRSTAVRHRRARLAVSTTAIADVWSSVAGLGQRSGWDVLDTLGVDSDATPATLAIVAELSEEAYDLDIADGAITIRAGGDRGIRHALVTLGQLLAVEAGAPELSVSDKPQVAFRGIHLDLARRWFEPDVVERMIDIAAWRKLSHVHLHLTDDEAWRFHVDAYPTLASIGGTRGHGLALAPSCGSGPAPYGRAYTNGEIGRWVQRADALGITLVPEVDVPGHCHAALVSVPELRDPDDASTVSSVQGYPNNVLVPGRPITMTFLEAVFATLADLFPSSPTLHIGGDEVPFGSWEGSPDTRAYAAARAHDRPRGQVDAMCAGDEVGAVDQQRLEADPGDASPPRMGRIRVLHGTHEDYLRALQTRFAGLDLAGLDVVLDCANGATHRAAPEIFRRLGADPVVVADAPDGRNINDGCGSTHVDRLGEIVVAGGHALGFAFDGDGDRLLAVDRHGVVVDGDELIALAALHLRRAGRLTGDGVAVTVMTNYGFYGAMEAFLGKHLKPQQQPRD